MRFLADEDFPKPLVNVIRNFGHSVQTIQQKGLQGSSDETVANIALKGDRIVLTFDKDFLENQPDKIQAIVFEFPRVPTSEIVILIEIFLQDLKQLKLPKGKILQFSKRGLEVFTG